jgi:hypothetical protein
LKEDLIEVEATFVDGLDENWISKSLVDRLVPDFPPKEQGYGHIGFKTVKFLGRIKIQWTEKNSFKTTETDCRVVKAEYFNLYLRRYPGTPVTTGPRQRASRTPSDSIEKPPTITPDLSSTSPPSPQTAVGAFDGLASDGQQKWIDDDAEK